MIDVTKASRETLEEYASAAHAYRNTTCCDYDTNKPLRERWNRAEERLRAECAGPKLRTCAERDADLVAAVKLFRLNGDLWSQQLHDLMLKLCDEQCAEPTAEEPAEPPSKLDPVTRWARRVAEHVADECDNDAGNYDGSDSTIHALDQYIKAVTGRPTSDPAELDLSEHEVCSCEEAEALKAKNAELERQLPEGMQNCTIKFIECPVGHGTLTATNWVQGPCRQCLVVELEERVEKQRLAIDALNESRRKVLAALGRT